VQAHIVPAIIGQDRAAGSNGCQEDVWITSAPVRQAGITARKDVVSELAQLADNA